MFRFVDVSNWQRGMDLAAVVRNGGLAGATHWKYFISIGRN